MIQQELFKTKTWRDYWHNMPAFFEPTRDTDVRNSYDVSDIRAVCAKGTWLQPRYPIYIISKGRSWINGTARALDSMGITYSLVIEPQELTEYQDADFGGDLLVLPFSDLGQGSIPARNWVLQHSRQRGDARHWIMDDNLAGFGLQKHGRRINTRTNGDMFRQCEDFVDRFDNVRIAGIRYRFHHNYVKAPYYMNTRIYSCLLIDNAIRHEWRGKFNEDTDLSLRVLKDGDCTMLFTWCYCNKGATLTQKGGNTDNVYQGTDDRREFAESLRDQHPDCVQVVRKFDRWHHLVDYEPFKGNELREFRENHQNCIDKHPAPVYS